ncbi:hypothetical protein Y88_1331 [Novosphingobium nitrogenifigens DSM 19370]|uniref:Uncharacterized protein n=1 Tax=Novosphingobium nitrogenifigens DSM 19370 TaxID=983920 RepID=F1Z7V6_9SPHN|nr:hypothetical protein Y88_1331 [Novosphingobium nitrogenifigens DSM 19370]
MHVQPMRLWRPPVKNTGRGTRCRLIRSSSVAPDIATVQ